MVLPETNVTFLKQYFQLMLGALTSTEMIACRRGFFCSE